MQLTKQHLTEYLPRHMIPIILKFIKQYKITNIKEHDYYLSGGGCYHYFVQLQNNKILHFSNDSDWVEISFNEYNEIYVYYDFEMLGNEHNQPNYEKRRVFFNDIKDKKINKKMFELIHSIHDKEFIDINQHFEDDLKLIEIDTPFGLIVIRHGNLATPPTEKSEYIFDIILNRTLLGSFFISSDLKSKKIKYKINYQGLTSVILDKKD
jgi:hypothetical protein